MKVGIGISGGVDSAVAARRLLEMGHEVVAFTMLLTDGQHVTLSKAADVAARLGIEHRVIDLRQQFDKLILEYFVSEYACGRTPSPCVRCNCLVKFGLMLDSVLSSGCDMMATGHYARLEHSNSLPELMRGQDRRKDQSYFLAQVPVAKFRNVVFPLGEMEKGDVKNLGDRLGLVSKSEAESQDLCFLPNGGFPEFVSSRIPELRAEGKILGTDGKVLGRHTGAYQYTVGQRRGLGLGGGPWFVLRVDMKRNEVVIGHQDELHCDNIALNGTNWLIEEPVCGSGLEVEVQLRYLMKPRKALLTNLGSGSASLVFAEEAPLVPPGQMATAYVGERVIAGGWICGTQAR